ncbi:MAG: FAD-binding oxidoreductase [Deltaproteobacteria bacterium]|nr:FAD-binding oxidoreductase [Deltaproteobacteria bacterium]
MADTAEVVIIGGGVMGCSLAYNLGREGVKAVVIEKSDIGGEASGSNGGGVRQSARKPQELPLAMASVQLYGQLHEELGMSVEYVRKGNLRLCVDEGDIANMSKAVANQKAMGLELEMLDAKQVKDINPYVSDVVIGASYCPTDGHANPFLVTYGFMRKAKELGAVFRTHEEVKDIRLKKGRVAAVVTNKGVIETDLVVNAAGVAGRAIANMVGLDLPMRPIFSEALITEPYPPLFPQMVGTAKSTFYGRQVPHGPFFWGGFTGTEEFIYRGGKPLFYGVCPSISRRVLEFFPALKDVHVIRTWSGIIAQMSDGIPVLGLTEEVPGFVFCTGFSGHGFGIGPIIGKLMCELIMDCQVSIPLKDFCFSRFRGVEEHSCTCPGNSTCQGQFAVCPNKRQRVNAG